MCYTDVHIWLGITTPYADIDNVVIRYYNPFLMYGEDRLMQNCRNAGIILVFVVYVIYLLLLLLLLFLFK